MSETSKLVRVALAGVPNAGKTLIFNLITGARARVSNWPGTTVEKRVGYRWHRGYRLEVVDLPGAYSLTAWSPEQEVAARFLVEEKPDVVVAVFDATNLEKSVYLALQLLEAGHKLVVALNKIDLAEGLGVEVDHWELSRLLSCPVVPMVATKALGLRELLDAIIDAYERGEKPAPPRYSGLAGELVEKLEAAVKSEESLGSLSSRRLAVGLLENDPYSLSVVEKTGASRVKRELEEARLECGGDCSLVVSKARLDLASSIASRVEKRRAAPLRRLSDLVDAAVLDKHLAVPVLLTVFWALFVFAFRASEPLVELADSAVASLAEALAEALPESALSMLIVEGVLPGVGAVLALLPVLVFFFLGLAVVDDSGYMARVSGLLDPIASRAGLSGRSTLPLAVCLGCNVVGVKAARVIPDARERLAAILAAPFVSCPARLPVYVAVSFAVLGGSLAPVALMYLLSFLVVLGVAAGLRRTLLSGGLRPLVVELPEYTLPAIVNVKNFVVDRTADFLKKAGTLIVLASVGVWALLSVGVPEGGTVESSLGARLASVLEPLFAPLGFDWRLVLALVSGFLAKEVVVAALAVILGVGEEGVIEGLREAMDPAVGLAFMTFVLLYTPCVATVAAIWSETRSVKWALFSIALSLLVAYSVSLLVYAVARAMVA